MRMLKFSGMIRILARVIRICLYVGIVAGVAAIGWFAITDTLNQGVPIAEGTIYKLVTEIWGPYEPGLIRAKMIGEISCMVVAGIFIIFILFKISGITDNIIKAGTPFVRQNAIFLKQCSILTILYSLLPNMFGSIASRAVLMSYGISGEINITSCEGSLFLAIVIYFISQIFKYGCELQNEMDEII